MTFPLVILILGVLYILSQPGSAHNLGESMQLFGAVAAVAVVAAVIGGIALVLQAAIQDFFGEWMLRRRRARTGRSL